MSAATSIRSDLFTKLLEAIANAPREDLPAILDSCATGEHLLQFGRECAARVDGCDLVFHHDGQPIADFRKFWYSACVINGLGRFYCRECRDERGLYLSALDAERKCPRCGKKWEVPKYMGRIFHDFRRSACYEMWKAGSTVEECMEVSGHATPSMFKRYAELFTEEERRARQRQVQERRHEWRQSQPTENLLTMPTVSEKAQ